jgi:hypothetical protein
MLLTAVMIGAVTGATLSLVVAHGLLRAFMEARGISPWSVRDSVGATVLVTLGAGAIGAAAALAIVAATSATIAMSAGVRAASISALALLGAVSLRLGLLALRKLT